MIGFAVGTSLGIISALISGKLRGRGSEVFVSLFGIPAFTYAFSVPFWDSWSRNTYICAGTCLTPVQWMGVEVFLSFLVALTYSYLRARKSLSIDEYVQISYLAFGISAGAVVLSSTLLPALIIPGVLAYVLFAWPREGSSIKFLNVERVNILEGAKVYTDEKSKMVFKDGGILFIGGETLRGFSHPGELAECTLMAPALSFVMKLEILILGFLPAVLLFFVPRGISAMASYGVVVLATAPLLGKVVANRTDKALPEECREVLGKYLDFLKKKRKKLDIVLD